jgi:hypothetical protein
MAYLQAFEHSGSPSAPANQAAIYAISRVFADLIEALASHTSKKMQRERLGKTEPKLTLRSPRARRCTLSSADPLGK